MPSPAPAETPAEAPAEPPAPAKSVFSPSTWFGGKPAVAEPPAPASVPSPPSAPDSDRPLEQTAVKRAASPEAPFDGIQSRKRMKLAFESSLSADYQSTPLESTLDNPPPVPRDDSATKAMALSHRLFEELTCGCCTELCYNVSTFTISHLILSRNHSRSAGLPFALSTFLLWQVSPALTCMPLFS